MTFSTWVAIIMVVLIGAAQVFNSLHIAKLRRLGRYPERGKATIADVERLVNMGSRGLAARCYREIHACSLREASEAVHALSTNRQEAAKKP